MSEKIVLIDGHSILNRAFYGLPDLTNSEGLHTNAVYGFLNILFRTLEDEQPQYLTVAFDVHAPTFRHQMYGEYKGTRKADAFGAAGAGAAAEGRAEGHGGLSWRSWKAMRRMIFWERSQGAARVRGWM